MGRSAQRHKGGGRRPEDSRGAECPTGLIPPAKCHEFGAVKFGTVKFGTVESGDVTAKRYQASVVGANG